MRREKKSGNPSFHSEGVSCLTVREVELQTCKKIGDNGLKLEFDASKYVLIEESD